MQSIVSSQEEVAQTTKLNTQIDSTIQRQPLNVSRLDNRYSSSEHGQCVPEFAPVGTRYLCYAGSMEHPELWLASEEKGMEKLLVTDELIIFQWLNDDKHIVYLTWPEPQKEPTQSLNLNPRPVMLMDVDSGEHKEIGKATATFLNTSTSGDVAFMNEDTIFVLNPETGVEHQIPGVFHIGNEPIIPPKSPFDASIQIDKIPDFLAAKLITESQSTTVDQPIDMTLSAMYPYAEVRFYLAPHGKYIALQHPEKKRQ